MQVKAIRVSACGYDTTLNFCTEILSYVVPSDLFVFWLYQVYSLGQGDGSKTGKEPYIPKKVILPPETKWVTVGRLPVMVKSKLCWLHELRETECQFDSGGYFIIKGMEKVLPDKIYHVHSVLN
jgi:hypothetical protein